ncbi:uncharacterized protein LOC114359356 [Ostrinia furnacalis]|uniref:uncharacterized protein LOC114359356 n=1 Tax=Ostrinia furnacalis TaxID=93504 RepID=UPI00103B2A0A|nr:uncharacterized protein LOC114359356 [Ostrinia furnacalis]
MASKFVCLLLLVCASYTAAQDSSDNSTSSSNDSSQNLSEPCSTDDLDCIRQYFMSNERCRPNSHEDGVAIHKDVQVSYIPKINVTVISLDDYITFYGSTIKKFYINNDSNNLVISIGFEGINLNSQRCTFAINQRGGEPKLVEDYVNATYSAEITAVISGRGKEIRSAEVSGYSTNAYPPFELGPKISESSDEVVQAMYQELVSDIPTAVQELLLTKAFYFFYVYLQSYICDYDIEYTGQMV